MKEIGSDFETVDGGWLRDPDTARPPWERKDEQIHYFESGRQAIGVLSRELRLDGFSTVLFPAYYCESMIAPFLRDGWQIQLVGVRDDWTLDPDAIRVSVSPDRTLIFSASYFGVPESAAWTEALADAAGQGARIVSDETHRVWAPGLALASYRVASLRKLLPLPDGGFLSGPISVAAREPSRSAALRREAMEGKRAYLAGGESRVYRKFFSAAEARIEGLTELTRMDSGSDKLLRQLDYGAIAARRTSNHGVLMDGWSSEQFTVTTEQAPVPAYCVVKGKRAAELRKFLIARQVYPPVHWVAPPAGYPRPKTWTKDVLSIPIDHRYEAADMRRVLEIIHEFEAKEAAHDSGEIGPVPHHGA